MFRKFISSTFLLIHSYIPHITENSKSAESGKIVELSHLIIWKLFQLLEKSCSKIFITREILRKIQNRIFVRQFSCWKSENFYLKKESGHCVKSVRIRMVHIVLVHILQTYSVSLCIQSECGKIWTKKIPNTDTFNTDTFAVGETKRLVK